MKTIQAKKMTKESFSKYGSYENLYQPATMGIGKGSPSAFYPDVMSFDFGTGHNASACVCQVTKRDMVIESYEYHNNGCEGILPLDADIVIFAGYGFPPILPVELEAFIVPKGTIVKLNPGVLHGTQFPVENEQATVVVMLPERTFATDLQIVQLGGEEKLLIDIG